MQGAGAGAPLAGDGAVAGPSTARFYTKVKTK